MAPNYIGRP